MPWADFHWRCAPDQPQPSAAEAPPQRHAGLGMQGQGGLASLVPSLVPAQRPSLPDGAPCDRSFILGARESDPK